MKYQGANKYLQLNVNVHLGVKLLIYLLLLRNCYQIVSVLKTFLHALKETMTNCHTLNTIVTNAFSPDKALQRCRELVIFPIFLSDFFHRIEVTTWQQINGKGDTYQELSLHDVYLPKFYLISNTKCRVCHIFLIGEIQIIFFE